MVIICIIPQWEEYLTQQLLKTLMQQINIFYKLLQGDSPKIISCISMTFKVLPAFEWIKLHQNILKFKKLKTAKKFDFLFSSHVPSNLSLALLGCISQSAISFLYRYH